jgi:hypothetical protein
MRVEIAERAEGAAPASVFPPKEGYFDLRANPHTIEQIAAARQHMPLRNFLTAVNGAESLFASASASTQADSPATVSAVEAYEFASQARLVFVESSVNFERERYADLTAGLKELLERDSGDAIRVVLRISPCDFMAQNRRGFCLSIRLVAHGASSEQAEMRWGLGLARLQQALLFTARSLRQQFGE